MDNLFLVSYMELVEHSINIEKKLFFNSGRTHASESHSILTAGEPPARAATQLFTHEENDLGSGSIRFNLKSSPNSANPCEKPILPILY